MSCSVIACYLALLISCPWNTDSSADQKFLLCLAHTKTNMAHPTQQGSLRLSTVLSGYLFYKHWNYWRGWIRVYSELLKFNDGLSLPHPAHFRSFNGRDPNEMRWVVSEDGNGKIMKDEVRWNQANAAVGERVIGPAQEICQCCWRVEHAICISQCLCVSIRMWACCAWFGGSFNFNDGFNDLKILGSSLAQNI